MEITTCIDGVSRRLWFKSSEPKNGKMFRSSWDLRYKNVAVPDFCDGPVVYCKQKMTQDSFMNRKIRSLSRKNKILRGKNLWSESE